MLESLVLLTTLDRVAIVSNVKAALLFRERLMFDENSFAEMVLWRLPGPSPGSAHPYKYRLAYVRAEV